MVLRRPPLRVEMARRPRDDEILPPTGFHSPKIVVEFRVNWGWRRTIGVEPLPDAMVLEPIPEPMAVAERFGRKQPLCGF